MIKHRRGIFRRRALLCWSSLVVCCAALAATQWLLDRQKQRAEAAERDFQVRMDAVYSAIIPFRDQAAARVAAGLNGGRPLSGLAGEEARPGHTLAGTVFDDRPAVPAGISPFSPALSLRVELPGQVFGPRYVGWVIHLHFIDDQLRGAYAITPSHLAYSGPGAVWLTMQWVLGGLVYVGAGFWCVCALLLPFNRPWRRAIAQAALAGLLVAMLARMLRTGWPTLSWSGFLHAPLLIAIAAAALLSLIGLLIPARGAQVRAGPAPCGHCGYDLTGNVSGVCPECGRHTPQGLVDRWRDEADRVAHIEADDSEEADEKDGDGEVTDREHQLVEQAEKVSSCGAWPHE